MRHLGTGGGARCHHPHPSIHPQSLAAFHWQPVPLLQVADRLAISVDLSDAAQMRSFMRSCIGTKFSSR